MKIHALCLLLPALALTACGGDDGGTAVDTAPQVPVSATPAPPPAPAPAVAAYDGPAAEITLAPVGDEMKYAQTEFSVAPGQSVHLTFTNTATSASMHHNVVVLKPDADVPQFGQASAMAASTDYIPRRFEDEVIAHTPMSAPGDTVEVTFTAPTTPGDYTYICSYPGHFRTMHGTMHVAAQPA